MATFRTSQPASAADPSRPHVVLVGLPGSGKSTLGRLAAEKLGRAFLDFDLEIMRREGMSIAQIFAERGEPAFRRMERELTKELPLLGGMFVAPGGGWIVDPENVATLRGARFVWLKVRPEVAIARLRNDPVVRPLLTRPDPVEELRRLLEERESLYAQAQYLINTEMVTVEQAVDRLVSLATAADPA
jgi:shikimate kinase